MTREITGKVKASDGKRQKQGGWWSDWKKAHQRLLSGWVSSPFYHNSVPGQTHPTPHPTENSLHLIPEPVPPGSQPCDPKPAGQSSPPKPASPLDPRTQHTPRPLPPTASLCPSSSDESPLATPPLITKVTKRRVRASVGGIRFTPRRSWRRAAQIQPNCPPAITVTITAAKTVEPVERHLQRPLGRTLKDTRRKCNRHHLAKGRVGRVPGGGT